MPRCRSDGLTTMAGWRRLFRDRPLVPLSACWRSSSGSSTWSSPTSSAPTGSASRSGPAIPLAILAALPDADLPDRRHRPVGRRGRVDERLRGRHPGRAAGPRPWPSLVALLIAALAGLPDRRRRRRVQGPPADHDPGHEPGRARPGQRLAAGHGPDRIGRARAAAHAGLRTLARCCRGSLRRAGPEHRLLVAFVPPIAAFVLLLLRRTGYGRLLYAIGDNPVAARLSGARSWQVLIVLYMLSALLAALAGFLYSGLTNVASVTLVDSAVLPSVAAAVIGGTSIMGGRGGYGGTIVGRPDPDRADLAADHPGPARGGPPGPVRLDHRGGRRGLHAGHRGVLSAMRDDAVPESPSGHRPRRHEHQVGGRRARRRRLADARPRPGRDPRRRRARGRRGPARLGRRRGHRALRGRDRRSASASPACTTPATGATRFLPNFPGAWAGQPVAGPGRRGARPADRPHQRRPRLRAGRAAAGRRRAARHR